jgi:hypothetical protein
MTKDAKLTDTEIVENRQERLRRAIDDSSLLVEFIAASKKPAPKDEVTRLIATQHAYADKPELSEKDETAFWLAYSALATAVRPATVEGIRYVSPNKNLGFFGWIWKNAWITFPVAIIAAVYLAMQVHIVRGSTLVSRYNATMAEIVTVNQAEPIDPAKLDALATQLEGLRLELAEWRFDPSFKIGSSENAEAEALAGGHDPVLRAQIELETASSYLLPFILGLLGACTQVLRSIAKRIGEQSMNPTLLPMYYIRVLLGFIIGTIIGLFMLPSAASSTANPFSFLTSLPLLTAAFIAGYGAEVLFTILDKFVNDLRSYISGNTSKDAAPPEK